MVCPKQLVARMTAPVLLRVLIEIQWAGKALLAYAQMLLQYIHQLWRRGPVIFQVHSPSGASYAGPWLVP